VTMSDKLPRHLSQVIENINILPAS